MATKYFITMTDTTYTHDELILLPERKSKVKLTHEQLDTIEHALLERLQSLREYIAILSPRAREAVQREMNDTQELHVAVCNELKDRTA